MTDTFGPVLGPMILWVPLLILLLVGVAVFGARSRRQKTGSVPNTAKDQEDAQSTSSQNATQPTPEPAKSKEKSSGSIRLSAWVHLLLWILAIIALYFVVRWAVPVINAAVPAPGPSWEERRSAAANVAPNNSAPLGSGSWQRIEVSSQWSSWIEIPPGYTIWYCDPETDTQCSAPDFSSARFSLECRRLVDGGAQAWGSSCAYSDANRVRAHRSERFTLMYRFVRAG